MTRPANDAAGRIAFIGGGNMARSLIGGMVARGVEPAAIQVAEPVEALRAALARDFGVAVHADAADAADGTDTWVKSGAGEQFSVPGNSKFDIRVTEAYHYICHFG